MTSDMRFGYPNLWLGRGDNCWLARAVLFPVICFRQSIGGSLWTSSILWLCQLACKWNLVPFPATFQWLNCFQVSLKRIYQCNRSLESTSKSILDGFRRPPCGTGPWPESLWFCHLVANQTSFTRPIGLATIILLYTQLTKKKSRLGCWVIFIT